MVIEMICVVPPCYCRTITPNVVSLSSKAWGPPWGAGKDSKPLSEPIGMCCNLKTFPGISLKEAIANICMLTGLETPFINALTIAAEFFLQFDFLKLSILLSTQPYSIAAESKVKTVLIAVLVSWETGAVLKKWHILKAEERSSGSTSSEELLISPQKMY